MRRMTPIRSEIFVMRVATVLVCIGIIAGSMAWLYVAHELISGGM